MTEKDLLSMLIEELTEHKLAKYRKENKEYSNLNRDILQISTKLQQELVNVSPQIAEVINDYIAKASALAYKDCKYLYVQGAKDCVMLLKELEII